MEIWEDYMARYAFFLSVAWYCVLFIGCATEDQQPDDAAKLWDQIHAEDYRSWGKAPGYLSRQPSTGPHADLVDIYINPVVVQALQSNASITSWPVDSLIVKDGFSEAGVLELVAVMLKRTDGWFYSEYFDGIAKFSGQPDACTSCHQSGDDFVRSFNFSQ